MSGPRSAENGADILLETRRRAERIDHYLDLIPARAYLGTEGEAQAKGNSRGSLDPARAKSTSQLIVEAAAAEGKASAGSKPSKPQKRPKKGSPAAAEPQSSNPNSRSELREKLERRIVELREERKRRQSASDKARAAEARGAKEGKEAASNGTAKKRPVEGKGRAAEEEEDEEDDGPEAGRVNFDVAQADLPFEATVGKRGKKVRKLRADLRKQEVEAVKLKEAEARGEGEAMRKDIAIRKAMQRARGEKVHDDVSKLRKVQKTMEMKKKKGKEKWAAKVSQDKQQVEEQQAQRKENLKNRSSKKKAKRLGFEGKRSDYINSDK